MLNVDIKLSGFDGLPEAVHRGAENGLDRAAQVTSNQVTRQKQRTYQRSIPRSKSGRPKWKRSGDWLQGTTVNRTGEMERTVTTEGNAAKYEARLANLPTGADGVNRSNPASENAARIVEPQLGPIIEQAIANELR